MNFGIAELYCGNAGKMGFYNSQEIGLARAMKGLNYSCFIFLPELGITKYREEVVDSGIRIVYCPAKRMGVHGKYDWRVLKTYDIDVVQVGADNQYYAPSLIRYCDKQHIPVYSYIGVTETHAEQKMKRLVMRMLYQRNRKIYRTHKSFAKTEDVKKQLEAQGVGNVETAPVGLDLSAVPDIDDSKENIRKKYDLPTDKTLLLYVGRMEEEKSPGVLLEIMESLPDDYYALLIGDGRLSGQIERGVKAKHLNNRMRWIRRVPNHEVHQFYRAADYNLNFTRKEIFGMSILEAMYQGCTVVAFHAPGPDMIIHDGKTGYLVKTIEEMKDRIMQGSKIDSGRVRQEIIDNYTWDKSARMFDGWIKSAMK